MAMVFKKNNFLLKQAGRTALFLFICLFSLLPMTGLAQDEVDANNAALEGLNNTAQKSGIDTSVTAYQIIGYGINIFLGFLGVIFLILTIYGGFEWMTAGGSEEKVKKGRELMVNAVLGMIVILFSYLLTNFVIFRLLGIVT